MKNNFFFMSTSDQGLLIEKAAEKLNMPAIIIEKDIWICWLLEKIFLLPIKMSFKGGTSLSKVYNLISRFSEDCDITIDYHNFAVELDLKCKTRSQYKKISSALKNDLKVYVFETIYPFLKKQIEESLPNNSYKIVLSDDGEKLEFYYPSVAGTGFLMLEDGGHLITEDGGRLLINTNQTDDYLRDHVQIEFGCRNSIEPSTKYSLETYLGSVISKDLSLPKPIVETLSPVRTFFEKATLIHVECYRREIKKSVHRLSRHWYDLYALYNSTVRKEALLNLQVLENVLEIKKAFYNSKDSNYDACLNGKFRLIPDQFCLDALEQDYTNMINTGMFNEEPPAFKSIIEILKKLETEINEQVKAYMD